MMRSEKKTSGSVRVKLGKAIRLTKLNKVFKGEDKSEKSDVEDKVEAEDTSEVGTPSSSIIEAESPATDNFSQRQNHDMLKLSTLMKKKADSTSAGGSKRDDKSETESLSAEVAEGEKSENPENECRSD